MNIKLESQVRVSDLCDVCTKRKAWWIKLDNEQEVQVADITITINPFPLNGQPNYCSHNINLQKPRLKSESEINDFGKALFDAGTWFGEMISISKKG